MECVDLFILSLEGSLKLIYFPVRHTVGIIIYVTICQFYIHAYSSGQLIIQGKENNFLSEETK